MGRCQGRDRRDQGRARRRRRLRDAGRAAQRRSVQGHEGPLGWVERTMGSTASTSRRPPRPRRRRRRPDQERHRLVPAQGRRPQAAGATRCSTTSSPRWASPTRSTATTSARRCCGRLQYFRDSVLTRYQPQRKVAQIFLNLDQGSRCRSCASATCWCSRSRRAGPVAATPAQWRAARQEAEKLRGGGEAEGRPWWELAAQSDDSGSATRGGYLGWYDPAAMAQQFVPKFATAANDLRDRRDQPAGAHRLRLPRHPGHRAPDQRAGAGRSAGRPAREDPTRSPTWRRPRARMSAAPRRAGSWVIHYQYDAAAMRRSSA